MFAARMRVQGVPHLVGVDNKLVFWKGQSNLLFSKIQNNQAWVPLLEKVYAKIYGNYESIEAGDPWEVVHDLTGFPAVFYYLASLPDELNTNDKMWAVLKDHRDKNSIMTCATLGSAGS